ncbi:MAG: hypothetical protein GVY19_09140 [Bacteroidetes bacterium]|nr:hypothetical protein [Bacteroidota bacterium]
MKTINLMLSAFMLLFLFTQCEDNNDDDNMPMTYNPDDAEVVSVDRFSEDAGNLFVRTDENDLPDPNEPIDFDQAPFITKGLSPSGGMVQYYNFDVMPVEAAPIYVLFRDGEDTPVEGQLNIINVIPGDEGYNDFWHVNKVTVPADYVANEVASAAEIMERGYTMEPTNMLVNCPVVPKGSTADMRFGVDEETGLVSGWYKKQVVMYFTFAEKQLTLSDPSMPDVPLSDIMVSFNINPDEDGGGPPSGFMTEEGNMQTHNVVETVPTDDAYSPFWLVNIYDNADFDMVSDWSSAMDATILAEGAAMVNCPIVSVQ